MGRDKARSPKDRCPSSSEEIFACLKRRRRLHVSVSLLGFYKPFTESFTDSDPGMNPLSKFLSFRWGGGGRPWLFYKHFIENDECMKQKDICVY